MKNLVYFLGACLCVFACDPDDNVSLDLELERLLIGHSPIGDADYFALPDGEDLSAIPQDPMNPLSDAKIELGKLLFHETALAINPMHEAGEGTYSCASCHHAGAGFASGNKQGIGDGGAGFGIAGEARLPNTDYPAEDIDVQPLRSPSALNVAYQTNLLWNGQFGASGINEGTESLWEAGTPLENNHLGFEGAETQAIAGLGVHRMGVPGDVVTNPTYRDFWDEAFADVPATQRYSLQNAGLAIAAYERSLLATEAPFQRWLQGNPDAMTDEEKRGAVVFFGDGGCATCHTGPALNAMEFHALGMDDLGGTGVFNVEPDADPNLGRASFTGDDADEYKFKVPQLYNLVDSPFFGHGSSFTSLREVIDYKNRAKRQNRDIPSGALAESFVPLELSHAQMGDLEAFLEGALRDSNLERYVPKELPSGSCFPVNDEAARLTLSCD